MEISKEEFVVIIKEHICERYESSSNRSRKDIVFVNRDDDKEIEVDYAIDLYWTTLEKEYLVIDLYGKGTMELLIAPDTFVDVKTLNTSEVKMRYFIKDGHGSFFNAKIIFREAIGAWICLLSMSHND